MIILCVLTEVLMKLNSVFNKYLGNGFIKIIGCFNKTESEDEQRSISHLLVRVLQRQDYFAMNLSNHSTVQNLLSVIPNPNLNLVQVVFFTLFSIFLEIAVFLSNIFLIINLVKKSPVPLSNHLMINLCAADLVKSCLYFIIYTTATPADSWLLGSIMCKVLPELLEGYERFSIVILTILARNRYHDISKPLKLAKKKKSKTYVVLFIFYVLIVGGTVHDGFERNREYSIEGATRCVDNLSLISNERYIIVIVYFIFTMIAHILQIYYFIRIACTLWKNSKHLGDNKLESSQRLKRNKKAVKTILTMVVVYDVVVAPTAILKTLALYNTDLSAFRELSNILLLIYCSFNSTFYIWRDERLKKTVMQFLARLFCRG